MCRLAPAQMHCDMRQLSFCAVDCILVDPAAVLDGKCGNASTHRTAATVCAYAPSIRLTGAGLLDSAACVCGSVSTHRTDAAVCAYAASIRLADWWQPGRVSWLSLA